MEAYTRNAGGTTDAPQGPRAEQLWSETLRLARLWWEEARTALSGWLPAAGGPRAVTPMPGRARHLYRSRNDRMIRGVCAGLAHYFGLPVDAVRILFLVLFFTGVFPALIPYAVLGLILPEEPIQ